MKDVPAVKMPMPLADLCHPERWPLRGRSDQQVPMSEEATLTPSADEPELVEEVATDVVPDRQDDEGPE